MKKIASTGENYNNRDDRIFILYAAFKVGILSYGVSHAHHHTHIHVFEVGLPENRERQTILALSLDRAGSLTPAYTHTANKRTNK